MHAIGYSLPSQRVRPDGKVLSDEEREMDTSFICNALDTVLQFGLACSARI